MQPTLDYGKFNSCMHCGHWILKHNQRVCAVPGCSCVRPKLQHQLRGKDLLTLMDLEAV